MLYSINEQNATVALQNVRSYGTEGREVNDPETDFVAPADQVHPFLLFRGQDIKDLHVHENQDAPAETAASAPAKVPAASQSAQDPPPLAPESAAPPPQLKSHSTQQPTSSTSGATNTTATTANTNNNSRRPRNNNNNNNNKPGAAIGTGASLLNRRARGVVDDHNSAGQDTKTDFDFQSHNQQFAKQGNPQKDDEAGDEPVEIGVGAAYDKDDFFDSISCDAIDKQSGVDNRLRGREERQLNTETFGAVALNNNRRRGYGRGGAGGRGGGRGRGGPPGGRGRSGGGRGRGGGRRSNNNINARSNSSSAPGGQQSRYRAEDS